MHGSRSRRWITAIAAALGVLGAGGAVAVAAPIDVASDTSALQAYEAYLTTVVKHESAWKTKADSYIGKIRAECPDVLARFNAAPYKLNTRALDTFGEEVSFEIQLHFFKADSPYQAQLQTRLSHLQWSSRATAASIANWQAVTKRLFHLVPSEVCVDAKALASSGAQTVPAGTRTWIDQYNRAVQAVAHGDVVFQKIVAKFGTAADAVIAYNVNKLLVKVQSAMSRLGQTELTRLATVLGLS